MEDLKQLIAGWVREARQVAKLSQEELGAKLAFDLGGERGYTKANVSHWETKKHQPSIQQLIAIARVTGHLLPPSISVAMRNDFPEGGSGSAGRNAADAQARAAESAPAITLQWVTGQEAELLSEFRASKESEKQFLLSTARRSEKVKSIAVVRDKAQSS